MKLPKSARVLASVQHQQRTLLISTKLPRRVNQSASKTAADPLKLSSDQETVGASVPFLLRKAATIGLGSWTWIPISRLLSKLVAKRPNDVSVGVRDETITPKARSLAEMIAEMISPSIDSTAARKIHTCEQIIGYTFRDRELLWEALQDPLSGVSVIGSRRLLKGNRRLALLGDKVLAMILVKTWYFTESSGYEWSKQQHFQSNQSLTELAVRIGLMPCLNWDRTCPSPFDTRAWGTLMEAVIAAVYLDGGFDEAEKLLGRLGFLELDGPPATRALVVPVDESMDNAEINITAETGTENQVLRRIEVHPTVRSF